MRFRSTVSILATPMLALALVGAACSNSESGSSTTTTSADSGGDETLVAVDAPGVTDSEIHVEGVASITNPIGGSYATAADGVNAYFAMVNSEGGVHGRQLVLDGVRDDKAVNNTAEVKGIVDANNVFAVLPVATLLFTGADTLVEAGMPTFGWTINPEWQGTEENPKLNLFGQNGSYLCLGCAQPFPTYVAELSDSHKLGLLAYNVPQSSTCLDGWDKSVDRWGASSDTEVVFRDASLAYGTTDLSVQVQKMKEAGADYVATCMDNNAVVTLAKEMKKQEMDAIQLLPNAYDQSFFEEFGDLFEGSYTIIGFAPLETPEDLRPPGLDEYQQWIEETGGVETENSIVGWLNAALFVQGLRDAGPDFSRQKVIDAINAMTDWTADGMLDPVDWSKYGHDARDDANVCSVYLKIVDGKMTPTEDKSIFTCFDITGDELVKVDG